MMKKFKVWLHKTEVRELAERKAKEKAQKALSKACGCTTNGHAYDKTITQDEDGFVFVILSCPKCGNIIKKQI